MKKPTYRSPADIALEYTARHVSQSGCEDCDEYDEIYCRFHQGYREGITMLLLRASVER